ncbi:hypothetical protein IMG5_206862 [Ichthyophthirius multifiliis]|uniref:Uncharacterized protein n=1 Tax=Ichthyophthirius multifiliis TaxID=5932 RepID=G0QNL3_ICHMU|nr:hypothetical protein IMG5_206862 [Ichthyophthirius multifiliis]EGR33202.1 hypothetical protein IMG5_206862 [Ichthyophthirius multifiliis]|eukprot:XP_004037188.1 hypothetical protein IMG5_206862 [Ichthyophthirius multifiliis]
MLASDRRLIIKKNENQYFDLVIQYILVTENMLDEAVNMVFEKFQVEEELQIYIMSDEQQNMLNLMRNLGLVND